MVVVKLPTTRKLTKLIDNQKNMKTEVYITNGNVYAGTRQLPVKDQRGRKYVYYRGRQINIKSIPVLTPRPDCVFDYVFNGGFQTHPCPAMDYWIMRWRMKVIITPDQFKKIF